MATQNVSPSVESSSDPVGQTSVPLPASTFTTDCRKVDDGNIHHFIIATGDDSPVHLDDSAARSIPHLQLQGHIVHGKLVQAVAIDLLRREELKLRDDVLPIIVKESWCFRAPLYPSEEIQLRYSRPGNMRLNRPLHFDITVFVIRNGVEVMVQSGSVTAIPTRIVAS